MQAVEDVDERAETFVILPYRRLVEKENFGLAGGDRRDGYPPFLPLREGLRMPVEQMPDPEQGRDFPRVFLRFRPEGDLFEDGGHEELIIGVLIDHPHLFIPGAAALGLLPEFFADVLDDRAPRRLIQPGDQAEQRGLSAPVFAEQEEAAALGDFKRHAAQNLPSARRKADVPQGERRRAACKSGTGIGDLRRPASEIFRPVLHFFHPFPADVPHVVHIGKHHVQPMFDDDDAVPRPGERAQRPHQELCPLLVEIGERLVEQDDLLSHRQRGRRDQPLFLPARKGAAARGGVELHEFADGIDLSLYLFGRKGEIFAAEGDLVPDEFLDDLFVGVLQYDADFAADISQPPALYIFARDEYVARKFSTDDVRGDPADDIHEGAFPLPGMPGKESDFSVFGDKMHIAQNFFLSVVGKGYVFQFDRVHNTAASAAPAISPTQNKASESAGRSFL